MKLLENVRTFGMVAGEWLIAVGIELGELLFYFVIVTVALILMACICLIIIVPCIIYTIVRSRRNEPLRYVYGGRGITFNAN